MTDSHYLCFTMLVLIFIDMIWFYDLYRKVIPKQSHCSQPWVKNRTASRKSFHENSCLVDLILVFLLHQVLPIHQLQKTLGLQVFQVLLDHHVLCEEMVEGMSEEKYCFASVALWPVGEGEDGTDLLLATDFESTCFSDATEPAMYLSQDSLALRSTSPRCPIRRVLDLCCGCGIQGIWALNNYAESAVFVDVNPRCLSFTSFNLCLNGLQHKCECLLQQDICESCSSLDSLGLFDLILANPPFIPNPLNIATGASLLFGNGGDDGEDVPQICLDGAGYDEI